MRKIVLYFGNELVPNDRAAIEVVKGIRDKVKEVEFYHCASPEELTRFLVYEKIILLDVSNVKDVTMLEDVSKVKRRDMVSLHDFDLNFFLKLLEKLGSKKSLKIVLIPPRLEKKVKKKLIKTLREV